MKDTTLLDVITFIKKCRPDELSEIKDATKSRQLILNTTLKNTLMVGQEVSIKGTTLFEKGIIKKVNKTRAIVKVVMDGKDFEYNVPFSMINP